MFRTIAARALFQPGDRVLVAVSGGPDSMALLHALWEARARLEIDLEVVGIDHGLRPEAARELDLVSARAEALELPFLRLGVDVVRERRRGVSLQDAARRARLGALAALAETRGARRVALGHQADDQAETVLFRILRGTGMHGLGGIPYERVPFVRPLLDVRRSEVLRYLRRRAIPFVEDPSNADLRFARARLRHQILPRLAEENPQVVGALLALAAAARGDTETLALPAVSRRAAASISRLRARGGTAAVDVSGRRRVVVSYGRVQVEPREAETAGPAEWRRATLQIDRPGRYRWCGGTVEIAELSAEGAEPPAGEGQFDSDRLGWPLIVRGRKAGDRMRPRGGRGSRKLSDLMIDAKIARGSRAGLPVVTTARNEVLFVPGLRPAEMGRPTPGTRRLLRVGFSALADPA
ncbi:MAG TPA: tRNA lysidine(34) synthetase TilS [Polyangia bacterium]|nr:tRNA lysidine(34) synthetase TilS [Polyangia bacterium]